MVSPLSSPPAFTSVVMRELIDPAGLPTVAECSAVVEHMMSAPCTGAQLWPEPVQPSRPPVKALPPAG